MFGNLRQLSGHLQKSSEDFGYLRRILTCLPKPSGRFSYSEKTSGFPRKASGGSVGKRWQASGYLCHLRMSSFDLRYHRHIMSLHRYQFYSGFITRYHPNYVINMKNDPRQEQIAPVNNSEIPPPLPGGGDYSRTWNWWGHNVALPSPGNDSDCLP